MSKIIDVREEGEKVTDIIFSDGNSNGLGKVYKLNYSTPCQFHIVSRNGGYSHVKIEDVDNLIKALQTAKRIWSEQT